jgi:mycothiol synthase
VDEHDRLAAAVVERIGDVAPHLDDPSVTLEAVADTIAAGPVAGLLVRRDVGRELWVTSDGDPGPVVAALVDRAAELGGGPLSWFAPAAGADEARAAAGCGLQRTRAVLQLRRQLPLPERATVPIRPYEPDRDRGSWIEVNNRAFAWHPDQGGWSEADVRARERGGWFDPAGFLLHEIDGRLAAFCWTKVHAAHDPPLGEIYVIAVDPDFRGLGLGRELTLAGLDHLAGRGLTVGMLYVEDDNEAALGLYRGLGFRTHHEDVYFTGTISPA